jgi:hypothetical protein
MFAAATCVTRTNAVPRPGLPSGSVPSQSQPSMLDDPAPPYLTTALTTRPCRLSTACSRRQSRNADAVG